LPKIVSSTKIDMSKREKAIETNFSDADLPENIGARLANIEAILARLEKKMDLHSTDLENKTTQIDSLNNQVAVLSNDISTIESSFSEPSIRDIVTDELDTFFRLFTTSPTTTNAYEYSPLRQAIQQITSAEVSALLLGTMEEGFPKPFFQSAQRSLVELVNSDAIRARVMTLATEDRSDILAQVTEITTTLHSKFLNYAQTINERLFPNCFFDTNTYDITIGLEFLDSPLATDVVIGPSTASDGVVSDEVGSRIGLAG